MHLKRNQPLETVWLLLVHYVIAKGGRNPSQMTKQQLTDSLLQSQACSYLHKCLYQCRREEIAITLLSRQQIHQPYFQFMPLPKSRVVAPHGQACVQAAFTACRKKKLLYESEEIPPFLCCGVALPLFTEEHSIPAEVGRWRFLSNSFILFSAIWPA